MAKAESQEMVSAGTLALLVMIMVPVLTSLFLVFLFIRRHTFRSGREEVHCARCHALVAVQGVEQRPQTIGNYNQSLLHRMPQSSPGGHLGLQIPQQLAPDIVVNPPNEIRGQDSATFQRLGMVAPRRSNLSERALAVVESAALSPKASPPMSRHALITPAQKVSHTPEELQSQAIPNFNETNGDKMNKVRMIEFSATPRAKTPDNAARRERRKTKVVPRTISPLHPTRRCGDGFTEGMEMLEASRMDRTDVTQGDLEELCESGLGGNMRQEDVSFLPTYHRFDSPYASILEPTNNRRGLNLTNRPATDSSFNPGLLGLPSPSGDQLTPGTGSSHTPASLDSASRTLTETAGLEEGLDGMEEAEQAEQRSNNNNTGSCGGQCSNNKEGEENMNIQGSNRVFLSNNRFVTIRDEESVPGDSDEVFLAEEESHSFEQQVSQVTSEGGHYIHPLAGHHRPPLPPTGSKLERSSSLPDAVKRKNSLVDVMREQRKEKMLFRSSFESEAMPGKRCPPKFPQEKRRGSKSEVSDIDGRP